MGARFNYNLFMLLIKEPTIIHKRLCPSEDFVRLRPCPNPSPGRSLGGGGTATYGLYR